MNTIGFCSSLNDLLRENDLKILDGGVNDIRIVGTIALLIMVIICAVGMEWESKVKMTAISSFNWVNHRHYHYFYDLFSGTKFSRRYYNSSHVGFCCRCHYWSRYG